MSHQTGITASGELKTLFAEAREKSYRAVKVGIDVETEKLVPITHREESRTWDVDYDAMVPPLLEENAPCYLFYRLDEQDSSGQYWWLFIVYSPEYSEIKYKMLYAATKSTLKSAFGSGQIKNEIYVTAKADATYDGYLRHVEHQEAPAPLTASEEEKKQMIVDEGHSDIGSTTKQSHLHGMMFPVQDEATEKLESLKNGDYTYVRLSVDLKNEKILLDDAANIEIEGLPSKVSSERAGYHLFNFKHTHEGDFLGSIVLIYSVPGYKCPVKERMIYTSLLGPFSSYLQEVLNFEIAKRIEISEGDVLTKDFLMEEIHPVRNLHKPTFAKPKGPAGKRGQRRLIKEGDDQ